jgi:hypothetical protein
MNKKNIILTIIIGVVLTIASCYNNKEDILALPKVSFRGEVVPIVTAAPCGCHNNENARTATSRAVPFSHADTVFYDAILARKTILDSMARFADKHPGGGVIEFSVNEKIIIRNWIDQGGQDDVGGCTVTGVITYTDKILPIYTTSCKGATCHGGVAPVLDYNRMVTKKDVLTAIMSSGGNSGHPGGAMSLSTCTINIFKEWIKQGQPQ